MVSIDPVFVRAPQIKPLALEVRPLRLPPEELRALTKMAQETGRSFNDLSREAFSFGVLKLNKFPSPVLGLKVKLKHGTWNISESGNLQASEFTEWIIVGFSENYIELSNPSTGHTFAVPRSKSQLERIDSDVLILNLPFGVILYGNNIIYTKPMAHGYGTIEIEGRKRIFLIAASDKDSVAQKCGLINFILRNSPSVQMEIPEIGLSKSANIERIVQGNKTEFFHDGKKIGLEKITYLDILKD